MHNINNLLNTVFGLVRFSDTVAITYEIPIAKEIDYSDVDAFKRGKGLAASGSGSVSQTSIPFDDLDSDGDVVGVGDSNFRVFLKRKLSTNSTHRLAR